MASAPRDENFVPALLAVSSVDGVTPVIVWANPTTHAVLVEGAAAAGTVTSVSVVSANGFAGTVATATTTPAITLTTTITGILQGNGTAISAAATTGSGSVVLASGPTLSTPTLGAATGTSLALGGATLGTNALAITGTQANSSFIQFATIADPSTPAAGFDRLYAQTGVDGLARLTTISPSGFTLTIHRDLVQRVFNAGVSTLNKGSAVYISGAGGGLPAVSLSRANDLATADVSGILLADAAPSGYSTIQLAGLVKNVDTSAFNVGDSLWLSDTTPGGFVTTAPTKPNIVVPIGTIMTKDASTGTISLDIVNNPPVSLASLTDTDIASPVVDQFLRYNGTNWVNSAIGSSSAGAGIFFYNASPTIIAASANNSFPELTLSKTPVVTAEQTITGTGDSSSTPIPYSAWLYDTALGRTVLDGGLYTFRSWVNVNNATGTTTISRVVYAVLDEAGGVTGTSTGTLTSRTFTASGGTPFATAKIDTGGTPLTDSYLKTPQGIYRITGRTNDTTITIATPSLYANENNVAFSVWKKVVYSGESPDINTTTASGNYDAIVLTVAAAAYTITTAHKLGVISFVTSTASRVVTTTYDGTTRNTHIETPFATIHNNLPGLQGGTGSGPTGEYYHLTSAEYTGSGTGVFARVSSPAFTTPNIGSATGSVSGNAGTVTGATFTTALTVNGGTLTLTANVANNSVLTIGAGAVSVSGSNTGDQTLPVKASGAELDTGTDDAKFATAKALKDSHNVPSVAPSTSGNVLTSNGTDWTSAAPTAAGLSSKAITFTRDITAASGDVGYTGVGFIPTAIIFTSIIGSTDIYTWGVVGSDKVGKGIYRVSTTAGGSTTNDIGANIIIYLQTSAGNSQAAIVKTFDADGFTLTWTKSGSPTGTGYIIALCLK